MTFSLVGRCVQSGQFGVVISSSSPAVAARCAFVQAGVGAATSQNVTNPRLGLAVLYKMAAGADASSAVASVMAEEAHPAYRQILAVDADGGTAIHSGPKALGVWAEARGRDCAAGGNLLADAGVPAAMVAGFEDAEGALGDRLMAALQAGQAAGGEAGPVHSAGLLIADREAWPWADLRCDWTLDDPIAAVAEAWAVYKPQADAYVTRALNPSAAPSYGVPGDA